MIYWMVEILTMLLKDGANPALRYQNSLKLCEDLAKAITQYFEDEGVLAAQLASLIIIITDYDYRLAAEYLAAWQNRDEVILSIFHRMLAANHSLNIRKEHYQLTYTRFVNTLGNPKRATISFTSLQQDVFAARNNQIVIYLYDEQHKIPLMMLIEAVGAMLSSFVEQQYDIPGLNAVVRQGLVRKWHLPDGTAVVSKRENAQKKDRFRREQSNYAILINRFGRQGLMLPSSDNSDSNIIIRIAQPLAVIYDGYSRRNYALSVYEDGLSLEDILLSERDSKVRNRLLGHYRLILDTLYEYGVLWGDMSPRNILMKQQGHTATYILVDFEKTRIFDEPISVAQRIEHCRGQICVEEIGVLCPEEEVLACFKDYFDPSAWDLESKTALPFLPRPEIADILEGRGIINVTLGEYNTIDKAIREVRLPDIDPQTKTWRFPGHLGFKVEHYLSCAGHMDAGDYDRKTTEILIAAKQQGCFDDVVALLADVLNTLEGTLLKAEFMEILQGGFSGNVMPPQHAIDNLIQILDSLYQARLDKGAYQHLLPQWQDHIKIGLS